MMEPRLIIAYSLILLMALFVTAFVGYHIYHSHERSYARRLRRERQLHTPVLLEREDDPSR